MISLLIDTSVLVTWFVPEPEKQASDARSLRDAHVSRRLSAGILDLALYELGNALVRRHRWSGSDVTTVMDYLTVLLDEPVRVRTPILSRAATLAERHGLSFYDACWAAAARHLGVPLVSADRQLLAVGLAETAAATFARLGPQR